MIDTIHLKTVVIPYAFKPVFKISMFSLTVITSLKKKEEESNS